MNLLRCLFLFCLLVCTSGFTAQPAQERKVQETLPQSRDEIWDQFARCKLTLDAKTTSYSIAFTPEIKAMDGKPVTISGFMVPLEAKEQFSHYLLSKRTPTCPFCPPGLPNEIVEVFSKEPVKWEEGIVVIKGTLALTSNPEAGLFFQMKDAEMVNLQPYIPPRMTPAD